ncbi:helix-turn-helix domain-containing protein [Streptomyces sp. NPDC058391]|uniref:helix-turn-helix domain-containing protein n=1 Tax=Streptomyces sp. NPDC058391 TaxID=3346476 RepID=UPI003666BC26
MENEELAEAGRTAESTFLRQMKHRRIALGMSQAELAERVSALGGALYQQTIAKLESGQRALRMSEADVLAAALGVTVQDMLTSGMSADGDSASNDSISARDLAAELVQVEERLAKVTLMTEHAAEALSAAQRALVVAEVNRQQAEQEHADLMHHYQYLLGRLAAHPNADDVGPTVGSRLFSFHAAGDLQGDARKRVEAHLRDCSRCRAEAAKRRAI